MVCTIGMQCARQCFPTLSQIKHSSSNPHCHMTGAQCLEKLGSATSLLALLKQVTGVVIHPTPVLPNPKSINHAIHITLRCRTAKINLCCSCGITTASSATRYIIFVLLARCTRKTISICAPSPRAQRVNVGLYIHVCGM